MAPLPDSLVTALADHYVLERELGQGGMAKVYLAQDLKHRRLVALKVLHAQRAPALAAQRFRREIELVARLQHPHILPVFDSGDTEGHLWFTMPYIEGGSLRERIRREERLPLDEALRLATQLCRTIDYAHRQGIVHRDIKPANILLTKDGDPLVADFGIARALEPSPHFRADLTDTGAPIGTPAYMAPEQASADTPVDARADQYALAVTIFEMLSGQLPVTAQTPAGLIAQLLGGAPSIRIHREDVPANVDEALARAMALDPRERFDSVASFGRALGDGTTTVTPARRVLRRVPAWLALPLVAVIGVLLFRRGTAPPPEAGDGTPVIAVLPFDYQGDSTDAYFADGVADEVRSKLMRIGGMTVIARASSIEYRHSSKRPEVIARELGADYLLTGTLQWQKGDSGQSRVRVRPELMQVDRGQVPRTRWGEQFDVPVTDVFDMQTDIAERVAARLDLGLADSVSRQIAVPPTTNLQAYDAYLRGLHLDEEQYAADPATIRRAIRLFEQAVALDSTFAPAWARLAASRVWLYGNTVPTRESMMQARTAAERAIRLDPRAAAGRAALGFYYAIVEHDNRRARAEYQAALWFDPEDAVTLRRLATAEQSLGQWDSALVHAQGASRLDPRSIGSAIRLAWILRVLRRTAEARAIMDRTLVRAPTNLVAVEERVLDDLADGNLPGARGVVRSVPAETEPAALVAYLASYQDLYWVLDDNHRRLLLTLTPAEFDGDRATWALVRAETYWLQGDSVRMRSYADTARLEFARQRRVAPTDPQRLVLSGLALAFGGRSPTGIALAEKGVALMPIERDQINGSYLLHLLARVYVVAGQPDKAIAVIGRLLKLPYDLTPG
ncbi:MAG TPA: protein kinase, partial [Gemmatimonadales bacterium]|nr:protein kinase [Gemmatimonadales bacterium]